MVEENDGQIELVKTTDALLLKSAVIDQNIERINELLTANPGSLSREIFDYAVKSGYAAVLDAITSHPAYANHKKNLYRDITISFIRKGAAQYNVKEYDSARNTYQRAIDYYNNNVTMSDQDMTVTASCRLYHAYACFRVYSLTQKEDIKQQCIESATIAETLYTQEASTYYQQVVNFMNSGKANEAHTAREEQKKLEKQIKRALSLLEDIDPIQKIEPKISTKNENHDETLEINYMELLSAVINRETKNINKILSEHPKTLAYDPSKLFQEVIKNEKTFSTIVSHSAFQNNIKKLRHELAEVFVDQGLEQLKQREYQLAADIFQKAITWYDEFKTADQNLAALATFRLYYASSCAELYSQDNSLEALKELSIESATIAFDLYESIIESQSEQTQNYLQLGQYEKAGESYQVEQGFRAEAKKAQSIIDLLNPLTTTELTEKEQRLNTFSETIINNYGFALFDVPNDGDCFIHAILENIELFDDDENELNPQEIRRECLKHLENHWEQYKGFATEQDQDFQKYAASMATSKGWVDDGIFILALSREFQLSIVVIREDGTLNIFRQEKAVNTAYVGYINLHYVALISIQEDMSRIHDLVQEQPYDEWKSAHVKKINSSSSSSSSTASASSASSNKRKKREDEKEEGNGNVVLSNSGAFGNSFMSTLSKDHNHASEENAVAKNANDFSTLDDQYGTSGFIC